MTEIRFQQQKVLIRVEILYLGFRSNPEISDDTIINVCLKRGCKEAISNDISVKQDSPGNEIWKADVKESLAVLSTVLQSHTKSTYEEKPAKIVIRCRTNEYEDDDVSDTTSLTAVDGFGGMMYRTIGYCMFPVNAGLVAEREILVTLPLICSRISAFQGSFAHLKITFNTIGKPRPVKSLSPSRTSSKRSDDGNSSVRGASESDIGDEHSEEGEDEDIYIVNRTRSLNNSLEEYHNDISEKEHEITRLKALLEVSTTEKNHLSKQMDNLKREMSGLNTNLSIRRRVGNEDLKELLDCRAQLAAAQAEVTVLTARNKDLQEHLLRCLDGFTGEGAEEGGGSSSGGSGLDEDSALVAEQKRIISKLEDDVVKLTMELYSALQTPSVSSAGVGAGWEGGEGVLESRLSELAQRLVESEKDASEQRSRCWAMEAQLLVKEESVEELKQNCDEMRADLAERDARIGTLAGHIASLEEQLLSKDDMLLQLQEARAVALMLVEEAKKRYELHVQGTVAEREKLLIWTEEQDRDLVQSQKELTQAKTEISRLVAELEATKAGMERLECEWKDKMDAVLIRERELIKTNKELSSVILTKEISVKELTEKITNLQAILIERTSQLNDFRDRLTQDDAQNRVLQLEEQADVLRHQVIRLEGELTQLRSDKNHLSVELKSTRDSLGKTMMKLDVLGSEKEEISCKFDASIVEINRLRDEVRGSVTSLERKEELIKTLKSEKMVLESTITALEERLLSQSCDESGEGNNLGDANRGNGAAGSSHVSYLSDGGRKQASVERELGLIDGSVRQSLLQLQIQEMPPLNSNFTTQELLQAVSDSSDLTSMHEAVQGVTDSLDQLVKSSKIVDNNHSFEHDYGHASENGNGHSRSVKSKDLCGSVDDARELILMLSEQNKAQVRRSEALIELLCHVILEARAVEGVECVN